MPGRIVRVAAGTGLVAFAVLYLVAWARAWSNLAYVRSGTRTAEQLIWLGTSLGVVVAGVLALVGTVGLLRGRELSRGAAWTAVVALCAAATLPVVLTMTVPHTMLAFLPDPFRNHGPEWALYLPYDDALVWRSASLPFTALATAWAFPLLARELDRPARRGFLVTLTAAVGAFTILVGALVLSGLGALSLALLA